MSIPILVVSNDPGLRNLLRVCLKGNGHQLDMAQNGPAAMTKLNQQPYDVILLDYDRTEVGSMAVLEHIHDHHCQSRVVLMLAHDSSLADQLPTALGVQACLVKPFDPQAIEQILNAVSPLDATTPGPARRAQRDPRRDVRPGVRRRDDAGLERPIVMTSKPQSGTSLPGRR